MAAQSDTQMTQSAKAENLKPSEIEKGLSTMWKGAAEKTPGATATRVCTLNLIVFLPDKNLLDTALDTTRELSNDHPLRAALLIVEPETQESSTKGQVSGYCQVTDVGNIQICCEQIVITAKGNATDELMSYASDFLVADVPVVLWWMSQPPFGKDIFTHLGLISDYVIFDSRYFFNSPSDLEDMADGMKKLSGAGFGDLNWLRLNQWREQISDLFNDPDSQPFLGQFSKVSIEYADSDKPNPSQALLLAGWFASRIKWSAIKGQGNVNAGEFEFTVNDAGGREIYIRVNQTQDSKLDPGDLAFVRIETVESKAEFSLSRTEQSQIDISIRLEDKQDNRNSTYQTLSLEKLVAAEIEAMIFDPIYQSALASGVDLVSSIVPTK